MRPRGGLSPGYAHQLGGSSPGVTISGCNLWGLISRGYLRHSYYLTERDCSALACEATENPKIGALWGSAPLDVMGAWVTP